MGCTWLKEHQDIATFFTLALNPSDSHLHQVFAIHNMPWQQKCPVATSSVAEIFGLGMGWGWKFRAFRAPTFLQDQTNPRMPSALKQLPKDSANPAPYLQGSQRPERGSPTLAIESVKHADKGPPNSRA